MVIFTQSSKLERRIWDFLFTTKQGKKNDIGVKLMAYEDKKKKVINPG